MTKEELEELKHELDMYGGGIGTSDALKLIAEIERLQSEREWRPIETVPEEVKKYGTPVLVVHRGRTFWAECAENEWLCGLMVLEPTLWQPLPDSPEGGKE